MTTFLVLGSTGQIGWELMRCLQPLGRVVAADRHAFDLQDHDGLRRGIAALQPDVIVNAAAYTEVDRAETEHAVAYRANAEAPAALATAAARSGALLVHYSTDYVFDGSNSEPYCESDASAPLNRYGEAKLAGERAVLAAGVRHLILRTSWVYGQRGRNFLNTILRLATERDELSVVDDQIGAPTWSRLIAETTAQILARVMAAPVEFESGVFHLTASGSTSWHGFACAILERAPLAVSSLLRAKRIRAISSREFPTIARRPPNSRLSCAKLEQRFGLRMPAWQDSLELCLQDGCFAAAHSRS